LDRTGSSEDKKFPNWIVAFLLAVSLIGFIDAGYLTLKYYQGEVPNCSVFEGCETVAASKYTDIGGIPLALFGAAYYLFIFILTVAYIDLGYSKILKFIAYFTIIGLIVSVVLVFLQLFVVDAICLYCMVSAATSTFLFIMGVHILKNSAPIRS